MNRLPVGRREFLRGLGVGAMAVAAGGLGVARAAERRNVLFIAVDDLNDWIGCLGGHPQTLTPNLDALADRGTLFANAHCAAPACNPSRTALLTGLRPARTGVYDNNQPWRPVLADAVTLPQYFTRHGFDVRGGGKIFHGGFNDAASWPVYHRAAPHPQPADRPLNGIPRAGHFDWGPIDVPDEAMSDQQLADWGVEQLRGRPPAPWFLAVGFFRPHLPWYVPRRYFDRFPLEGIQLPNVKDDDLDDVPEAGRRMANPAGDHANVLATDNWRRAVQGYLASISFADTCIGRLIDGLDAAGQAENTILCLWGDHGWHLGEKLHWRKFALWEEATRNPLIIAAPGVGAAGQVCGRPASLLDVYPTLAELAGLPPPEGQDGQSLVPWMREPDAAATRPALTTHGRGNHSLRDDRWRYIRYADGGEELYDHDADELEWTNLAGRPEHRSTVESLGRWLPATDAPNAPRGGGGNDA